MDEKETTAAETDSSSDITSTGLGELFDETDEAVEDTLDEALDETEPVDALLQDVDVYADESEDLFEPDELEPEELEPDDLDTGGAALEDDVGARALERRIARLEAAARELAGAQVDREQRRVRRKVTAGTTAAGTVGFIPILLQLVGALNLEPELAAAVSTAAASLGALIAGYMTPEREPPLAPSAAPELLQVDRRPSRRARRQGRRRAQRR